MSQHPHSLVNELPEFKEQIQALKLSDGHFKKLYNEYEGVASELHKALEGAGVIDDSHAEELKKKRLELKDVIFGYLKDARDEAKTA